MNWGLALGGWQQCHGGILHILVVNVAQGGFCMLEAL
jgi:hypothetical protein